MTFQAQNYLYRAVASSFVKSLLCCFVLRDTMPPWFCARRQCMEWLSGRWSVHVLLSHPKLVLQGWVKDIESTAYSKGFAVGYPIIADADRSIAHLYQMLDPDEKNAEGLPMTCRGDFLVHESFYCSILMADGYGLSNLSSCKRGCCFTNCG